MEKTDTNKISKVYFIDKVNKDRLVELYNAVGRKLQGKIAVKLHTGEHDRLYNLQPDFIKPLVDYLKGTIVECNTAYEGRRDTTEEHWKVIQSHGYPTVAKCDIMDEFGQIELPVPNGKQIKKNFVGKNLANYDSILVFSHFKGHIMGGFGGEMKNTSIGIASRYGKEYIHGAGVPEHKWVCAQDKFLESMADAVKSVMEYKKDKMVFINVMKDMSIDCDCDSFPHTPEFDDIGMLASLDPVALDQACVDKVYQDPNVKGTRTFRQRMEDMHAIHILETGVELGIGTRKYELIDLSKKTVI